MKTNIKSLGLMVASLVWSSQLFAATVSFDSTADPGRGYTDFGTNGSYTEAELTLQATSGTDLVTYNPNFDPVSLPSVNNTDFAMISGNIIWGPEIPGTQVIPIPQPGIQSLTLSASSPFSLQSFQGATLSDIGTGTFTLTGNTYGGGTLTQVFNTLDGNAWSTFTLPDTWVNLLSVDISTNQFNAALDNITFSPTVSATPIPAAIWLFGSALLLGHFRIRKNTMS